VTGMIVGATGHLNKKGVFVTEELVFPGLASHKNSSCYNQIKK